MFTVEIKKLDPRYNTIWNLPEYATEQSAGLDLRAALNDELIIGPQVVQLIPTGLAIYINNPGLMFVLLPKSGLGHKQGIILGNTTGIIDSDYQGQIFVSVYNRNYEQRVIIKPGQLICQGIFVPVVQVDWKEVVQFTNESDRGEKGFGSATATRYGM